MKCAVDGICDFDEQVCAQKEASDVCLLRDAIEILAHNLHGCPVMRMKDGTFTYLTEKHIRAMRRLMPGA